MNFQYYNLKLIVLITFSFFASLGGVSLGQTGDKGKMESNHLSNIQKEPTRTTLVLDSNIKVVNWFSNSQLYYSETYRNNKLDGMVFSVDSLGFTKMIRYYKNGIEIGPIKEFYSTGELWSIYNYDYSEQDTIQKAIYCHLEGFRDGVPYSMDSLSGPFVKAMNGYKYFYRKNGTIEHIEFYKDNIPFGKWEYFDEKGELIRNEVKKIDFKYEIDNIY